MSMLKQEFFLVVSRASGKGGQQLLISSTTRKPGLKAGEVMVKVNLELPSTVFEKPALSATITLPETSYAPSQVDAEIGHKVADLVKRNLGVDMKIELVEPN